MNESYRVVDNLSITQEFFFVLMSILMPTSEHIVHIYIQVYPEDAIHATYPYPDANADVDDNNNANVNKNSNPTLVIVRLSMYVYTLYHS